MKTTHTHQRPTSGMGHPVTFTRVLRSEWIKLWSLRSTYWTLLATLATMVAIAVMLALVSTMEATGPVPDGAMAITMGYSFAQLSVAVLGVLTISGEYSTGMIRSTFAAVPRRLPVLAAKALLLAVVSFVLGVCGVALAYAASAPLFADGAAARLSDPDVQRIFWGTGLYLAGVALFGLAVGALVRHTAGAVTAVLGILLMLSSVWQLLMLGSDWFTQAYPFLPSVAGERIVLPGANLSGEGPQTLGPWAGIGVFSIYIAVALVAAGVLMRKRDA